MILELGRYTIVIGLVNHPVTRKCPGGPARGVTRSPGKLRVIVNLYRDGSNYGPQAVGTALDFIARAGRRANPRIYDAYGYSIVGTIIISNQGSHLNTGPLHYIIVATVKMIQ